jgi:uncharacterized protein involved in response to NO
VRAHGAPKPARVAAGVLFFPAAALYAALALPWSVLAMTGVAYAPAPLATPFGHAHELLVGYAVAVVAGHQLGMLAPWRLGLLLVAWASARVAFVIFPGPIAAALDIVFLAATGLHVAPRLFRAAKKLRNQALPAVLTALFCGAVAFDVAAFAAGTATLHAIVTVVVLLLATLMLFMGGRIIAPAAAGQLYRQGEVLAARVQPRIEAAIIVAMGTAVISAAIPRLALVLQLACLAAAALAFVRLLRWRLWRCTGRPDLLCLGVGYAWLALGLLAVAMPFTGGLRTAALHVVTVGALGTLTFNVMASTILARSRRRPADEPRLGWGTASIGLATVLRIAAAVFPDHGSALLLAAAACWSAAFLVLTWLLADALSAGKRPAREPGS